MWERRTDPPLSAHVSTNGTPNSLNLGHFGGRRRPACGSLSGALTQLMRKCAAGERWWELHLAGRAEKSINNSAGSGQTSCFPWQRGRPYPWKVNKERWGFTYLFIKLFPVFFLFLLLLLLCFFSPSTLLPLRLGWLRRYLELLTSCANIAYNVTLNMQIGTAQHLISHLSVKVPSVGSPGGPRTDVTASARQKHASGAEGRRGEVTGG